MPDTLKFFSKIIFFFAITLVCTVVAFLLISSFTKLWQTLNSFYVINDIWIEYIKLSLQTAVVFGMPVFICKNLYKDVELNLIPLSGIRNLTLLVFALLTWVLCLIPVNSIWQLNDSIAFPESLASLEYTLRSIQIKGNEYLKQFVSHGGIVNFIVLVIVFGVFPAFFEELFFRGYLQKIFYQHTQRKWLSIITTAIVFSIFHFEFYAFLPRILLGVLLGVAFHAARSLWLPVTIHFVNNLAALISNRFATNEEANILGNFGTQGYEWIILGILLAVVIYMFHTLLNKTA